MLVQEIAARARHRARADEPRAREIARHGAARCDGRGSPPVRHAGLRGRVRADAVASHGRDQRRQNRSGVVPIGDSDWKDIAALDREAFGADRVSVLRWCWRSAPEYAWLTRSDDRVTGFVFGRHGYSSEHIGPLVASSEGEASALLDACLRHCRRPSRDDRRAGCAVGVSRRPRSSRHSMPTAPSHGCDAGTLTIDREPRVFAVAGPEFG